MNPQSHLIVDVFERFMMSKTPIDQFEQQGRSLLMERVDGFVQQNKPVPFYMLGFPFKSSNKRDKVLGDLPDMAEQKTLENFARFDGEIKKVYSNGVKISMVSDGYVFNDLLGIEDRTVEDYKKTSMELGQDAKAPVQFLDLRDFYTRDIPEARNKVMEQFGITSEKLEYEILFNPDVNYLYRGMNIFMIEELAVRTFPSRHQLKAAAKKMVREMMLRNEAYSNLARREFGDQIRLSMHPSVNNGQKYSFKLIEGNAKYSAWHSAILFKGAEMETIHRIDAEQAGYELVYENGRPYYFKSN